MQRVRRSCLSLSLATPDALVEEVLELERAVRALTEKMRVVIAKMAALNAELRASRDAYSWLFHAPQHDWRRRMPPCSAGRRSTRRRGGVSPFSARRPGAALQTHQR